MYAMKSEKVYDLKDVFISLPYVGVDFLDRKKLKERNITVANSP
jgi:lactate dehydrogenase-like 2-hydroxyacid dehydrogenase